MSRRPLTVMAVLIGTVLAAGLAAWAYFSTTSSASQFVTSSTLGAPTSASAAAASSTSITVTVATGPSSPAATGYTVYPHGTTSAASCSISGATGGCTVSGLSPNTPYSFDVYSTLSNWISATFATVGATTNANPPSAPTAVTMTNGGGQGSAFINSGNQSGINVNVTLPSTSLSSDTVHLTASDGTNTVTATTQSGTAGGGTVTFNGLNVSSLNDGTVTFTAWASNSSGPSSNTTSTNTKDATTTVTTITLNPVSPNGSNGWYKGTDPTFTLSATDAGGSGVASTKYQIDGGTAQNYPGSPVTIPDGAAQTVSYWSVDTAANTESTHTTTTLKIDAASPTNNLSLTNTSTQAVGGLGGGGTLTATNVFLNGSNLYYSQGTGGSFTLQNAVSDATSGGASSTFAHSGTPGNKWTAFGDGTVSTPAGGPYTSGTFTWTTGANTTFPATATGTDTAGNTSLTSLSVQSDNTNPTATMTFPVNQGSYTSATWNSSAICGTGNICGTASANGAVSGLSQVLVGIQNKGNNLYWNWSTSAFTSAAEQVTAANGTTNWSLAFPTGVNFSDGHYALDVFAITNVGNSVKANIGDFYIDNSTPTQALTLANGATGASITGPSGGPYTVYYNGNVSNGKFDVVDTVTESGAGGIAAVTDPALATTGWTATAKTCNAGASPLACQSNDYGWSVNPSNPASQTFTASTKAGVAAAAVTLNFVNDSTAPTGSISYTNGYTTTASVTVTFNATDNGGGSGLNSAAGQLKRASATLAGGTCGTFSSFTNLGSAGSTSPVTDTGGGVSTGNCYEYEYVVPDNVGNSTPITSASMVKVDTVAPTNSLALTNQTGGGSFLSGTTVYYQGATAGQFTIQNTVADAASGPASSTFASLGGTTTGWTFAGSTVTGSSPYTSATFSWASNTNTSPTEVITGTDNATNATVAPTLTFVNDSSAPSGGAVTVNGIAASAAGTTSTTAQANFSIGSRTDYSDPGGSGMRSSLLTVQSESYDGTTCGAPGSGGPDATAQTITNTQQPTGPNAPTAGFCYLYKLTGTDNVGNIASVSTTVTVTISYTFTVTKPNDQTAGVGLTGTVTVQLQAGGSDTGTYYGNAYSGAHTVNFSGTAMALSPNGTAASPASTSLSFNGTGAATIPATLTVTKAATNVSLTVTDTAKVISGTSQNFNVVAGTSAGLSFTSQNPSATCNTAATSCSITINASGSGKTWVSKVSVIDVDGNIAKASSTVTVTITHSAAASVGAITGSPVTINSNSTESGGSFTYTAGGTAGSDTITATGSGGGVTGTAVNSVTTH